MAAGRKSDESLWYGGFLLDFSTKLEGHINNATDKEIASRTYLYLVWGLKIRVYFYFLLQFSCWVKTGGSYFCRRHFSESVFLRLMFFVSRSCLTGFGFPFAMQLSEIPVEFEKRTCVGGSETKLRKFPSPDDDEDDNSTEEDSVGNRQPGRVKLIYSRISFKFNVGTTLLICYSTCTHAYTWTKGPFQFRSLSENKEVRFSEIAATDNERSSFSNSIVRGHYTGGPEEHLIICL